jgi:hypothetical protein
MKQIARYLFLCLSLVIMLGLAGWYDATADEAVRDEAVSETVPSIHRDARALEDATLAVTRALLREDAEAARNALDLMARHTRRLDRLEDEALGSDILSFDHGFHVTLGRSRELAGKGNLEEAFNQFVWVQRSCVGCHRLAREQGLLPSRDETDDQGGG